MSLQQSASSPRGLAALRALALALVLALAPPLAPQALAADPAATPPAGETAGAANEAAANEAAANEAAGSAAAATEPAATDPTASDAGGSGDAPASAELADLWGKLTASDQAVIRTASRHMGSGLTTTRGTPNAAFWTALEKRGLMQAVPLSDAYAENAVPAMEAAGFQIFQITQKGSVELPGLLASLAKP